MGDATDTTAEIARVVPVHTPTAGVAEVVVALDIPAVPTAADARLPDVSVPPPPSSEVEVFGTARARTGLLF
ncbi:MAG: hypothetical protein ABEI52_12425 [Halobacteriaceae archaeon]